LDEAVADDTTAEYGLPRGRLNIRRTDDDDRDDWFTSLYVPHLHSTSTPASSFNTQNNFNYNKLSIVT